MAILFSDPASGQFGDPSYAPQPVGQPSAPLPPAAGVTSKVLAVAGASICNTTFTEGVSYAPLGAANFRRICIERGYDLPFVSYAVSGSDMQDAIGQISLINSEVSESFNLFTHCWGNDLSARGSYPADWDAAELASYESDVDAVVSALNSSSADKVFAANMTYRTNVSGGTEVNADIIEPKLTAGLVESFIDWEAASFAVYPAGYADSIHPNNDGAIALQEALLDDYTAAEQVGAFPYEDQIIISCGDGDDVIPGVAVVGGGGGTIPLITQRMETGGSVTVSNTAIFGSTAANTGVYQFTPKHFDLNIRTLYGNNNPVTADIVKPEWANREVEVQIVANRNATNRDTEISFDGNTTTLIPDDQANNTATFTATLDGSGSLPTITATPVNQYGYLTVIFINLLKSNGGIATRNSKLSIGLSIGL